MKKLLFDSFVTADRPVDRRPVAEVMTNRLDPDNRKLPNNREKKRMENQKLPMYLL